MPEEGLNPCPFCGSKAEVVDFHGVPLVYCSNRCCKPLNDVGVDVEIWNSRRPMTDLTAEEEKELVEACFIKGIPRWTAEETISVIRSKYELKRKDGV